MKIGLTGGTGFLGHYVIEQLLNDGHQLRCWFRSESSRTHLDHPRVSWVRGELGDPESTENLVRGCDAIVHSGLFRRGPGFRGSEGDMVEYLEKNLLGTVRLIESAMANSVQRFVFVSTCAVHEKILDDRPLDESHPTWATTHYGAHKAAIERFVHSYGWGHNFPICAIRPTGIYGIARPLEDSKWYELVQQVREGQDVEVAGGGKEVHVADVARGISLLLDAPVDRIRGEAFNCYDRYISRHEVAIVTRTLSSSQSVISGEPRQPRHQIETGKIRSLGLSFGGEARLKEVIEEMLR